MRLGKLVIVLEFSTTRTRWDNQCSQEENAHKSYDCTIVSIPWDKYELV